MKTKLILKTVLTLLIGVLIGVLLAGKHTMHKIHKAKDMRTEQGFMKHVFESFELEGQDKDSVRVIMENFARLNHQKHEALQNEIHEAHVALEASLSRYLSERELKRLKKIMRHHQPRRGKGHKKHHH
jgi:transcription termination factor NusB